jgi:uncharacterized protein
LPATIDLLDVNLWLALAHEKHIHHGRARRYWQTEALPIAGICRITHLAFLRLLTNRIIMGAEVLSPPEAWKKCDDFLALPEVRFFSEPPGLDQHLEPLITLGPTSQNLWTDAYLAAFANCLRLRLVTFDQGFERFPTLERLILTPES